MCPIQVFGDVDYVGPIRPLLVLIDVPAKEVLVTGQHPLLQHFVFSVEWSAVERAEWFIGMASHRHAKAFGNEREQLFEVVIASDAPRRQIRSERKDEDRLHYFDDWAPLELRCLLVRPVDEDDPIDWPPSRHDQA